eukprot:7261738-Karenia_brevis.AAC.1
MEHSSRKSARDGALAMHRRLERDRSHGEIFPLPMPRHPGVQLPLSAPRYARQRRQRRIFQHGQESKVVEGLNRLAAARANDSLSSGLISFGRRLPTHSQDSVLKDLHHRVAACGGKPADLDERGALAELMASKSLYGQEPLHLAPYDLDLLKVARGKVLPRDPISMLPVEARGYLRHFDTQIEQSADELLQR